MGGASGLGLGLVLAQPGKRVIVMDGDASLLMELGSLATVVSQQPPNFLHCVVNNGTQFSGLANMEVSAPGFDFAEVARAAGYRHAERISDGAVWAERFPQLLAMEGPVFVELMVDRLPQQTKVGFAQQELPANQYTCIWATRPSPCKRGWLLEALNPWGRGFGCRLLLVGIDEERHHLPDHEHGDQREQPAADRPR